MTNTKTTISFCVLAALLFEMLPQVRADLVGPLDYPGARHTYPVDIDGDLIVGYYEQDAPGDNHGFIYDGYTWLPLDVLGAQRTYAHGIQGSTIVGGYKDGAGHHGFVYDMKTGATLSIDYENSSYNLIYGIEGSVVVGICNPEGVGTRGFAYDLDTDIWSDPILVPGSHYTYAYDIDGDSIVGSYMSTDGTWHGFRYYSASDEWINPIDIPEADHTSLSGVEGELLVGHTGYASEPFNGYLYNGLTWMEIEIPDSRSVFPKCVQNGRIVGSYRDLSGQDHGFLLTLNIPVEVLLDLEEVILTLGLSESRTCSLLSSLETAVERLSDGNPKNDVAAINLLEKAFINKVAAQSGKEITPADAEELIAFARHIIDLIIGY